MSSIRSLRPHGPSAVRRRTAVSLVVLGLCGGFASAARADVTTPSFCAGDTLYSYIGASTSLAPNVAQNDCYGNVAVGPGASSGTDGSNGNTATGSFAQAQGGSVAVGVSSAATGTMSTAIGPDNAASGAYGVAVGNQTVASGEASVANGNQAIAAGSGDIAIGNQASTQGFATQTSGNIAIGSGSGSGLVTAAIGGDSIAIGSGALSLGSGSVVLGANSNDGGVANVVSFGSSSVQRSLINVADITSSGSLDARGVRADTISDGSAILSGGNLTTTGRVSAAQVWGSSLTDGTATLSGGDLTTTGTVSAGHLQISGGASVQGGLDNGDGGITRAGRISGVSAGTVDANSDEAVNGAQLYATDRKASAAQTTADAAQAQGQQNSVQIQALVNGQLGVCTVRDGALQCSVSGQAAAHAQGTGATAVGIAASAQGAGAQAMGRNATASGEGTTAFGDGAQATQAGAVAIGRGAIASGDPTVAIGDGARASGNNAVALGADARALAADSVALGEGSVADRAGTVSVGDAATGTTRQIANVAPGTAPTDAVNVAQLQDSLQSGYGRARTYAAAAVAQAAALTQAPVFGPTGNALTAGVGSYDGQSAIGVQYHHRFVEQVNHPAYVSVGMSANNSGAPVLFHAGVGIGW